MVDKKVGSDHEKDSFSIKINTHVFYFFSTSRLSIMKPCIGQSAYVLRCALLRNEKSQFLILFINYKSIQSVLSINVNDRTICFKLEIVSSIFIVPFFALKSPFVIATFIAPVFFDIGCVGQIRFELIGLD